MIQHLILLVSLFVFWRLIKKDVAERDGVSSAIWIPTLWVGIALSRPISLWLNWGGGDDSLEGSPLDRLFFFGSIFGSVFVLSRRRVAWADLIRRNWPIFLFYGYLLVSIVWAPYPFVSFKRWFKDFGNVFVALVILTEENPLQAIRAVFVRCAYVLIPLSVVFIRYIPDLGRFYSRSGGVEITGVTTQKNSLGILVLICGLVLLWDWLERTRAWSPKRGRMDRYLPIAFLVMGVYLLHLCDSVTSILCLIVGSAIVGSPRMPFMRNRAGALGILILLMVMGFFVADSVFHIKGEVLHALGRNETLTGRTDVWAALLDLKTDPILGIGFCSIWSDRELLAQLPPYVGKSAHNGYLEMYIDGGYMCLFFLSLMILVTGFRLNRELASGENYALIRFAIFVAAVIGNISESHWARMAPLWFFFLLIGIGHAERVGVLRPVPVSESDYAASSEIEVDDRFPAAHSN